MPTTTQKKRYDGLEWRLFHIGFALLLVFVVLVVRLWQLQVVRGMDYGRMAEENRLHPQRLKSPRGMIYGRNGVILADNRPACDLVLVPAECDAPERVCARLGALLDIDGAELLARLKHASSQPFEQVSVKRDVSKTDLMRVEEHAYALPGVFTVVSPQRRYVHHTTAGQILGFLGEIGPEELESRKDEYHMGDWIGREGIEQVYEDSLHGTDGHTMVTKYAEGAPQLRSDVRGKPYIATKDSYGHELAEDHRIEPMMGDAVHLTLDIDLQAHAEALLANEVGAIVVLNADTGEVLALASTPSYDPAVFVTRGTGRERQELLTAGYPKPMVSRAYREAYAPGSVFKVLLACAALEEGVIDKDTRFFCPGFYQIDGKGRKWHCWKHAGHGWMAVVDALAFSCDVFFYNVGCKLGIEKIDQYANALGLGVKTGIDLPREEPGLIPSIEWKRDFCRPLYPEEPWEWEWRQGDTVNTSIGQGSVTTTPLQNAVLMAAVINGGYRVRPYLNSALAPQREGPFLSERTLEIVRQGMFKCIDKDPPAPTGTGNEAKTPGVTALGKTGSAQVVALKHYEDYEEEDIPYEMRDHAWFVVGVMNLEPRIAVCVLVEHGLHGSSAAAPLAKDIINYFYRDQLPPVTVAKQEGAS